MDKSLPVLSLNANGGITQWGYEGGSRLIAGGTSKDRMARRLTYIGNRDILSDCNLDIPDSLKLQSLYEYLGIARRAGDAFPNATWSSEIKVTDTEDDDESETQFQRAWDELTQRHNIWNLLTRLDKVLSYSSWAVLRFGIQDGRELTEPAGKHALDLDHLFFSVHGENNAGMFSFYDDPTKPDYQMPMTYDLRTGGTDWGTSGGVGLYSAPLPTDFIKVHASRVLHVAENRTENDIIGKARLQHIHYYLLNLLKVSFSAAESWYFKVRCPYILNLDGDTSALADDELEDIQEMWQDIIDGGFSKALVTKNGKVEIASAVADDPSGHVATIKQDIAGAMPMPMRILDGSERGELASSQDANNWNGTIEQRRKEFAEPEILLPFIWKCIDFGILPEPRGRISIEWPPMTIENAKDKAETANMIASAIKNFEEGMGETYLTRKQFVEDVLKMPYREDEINEKLAEMEEKEMEMQEQMQPQNDPKKPQNSPQQAENNEIEQFYLNLGKDADNAFMQ